MRIHLEDDAGHDVLLDTSGIESVVADSEDQIIVIYFHSGRKATLQFNETDKMWVEFACIKKAMLE